MDAWADGLNCYLATHPQVQPAVITRFEPWMALSFSEGSIGGDIERVPLGQLEAFYGGKPAGRCRPANDGLVFREPHGSNGFAIAPAHTKNGHALLLINPHTSFFFRSELQMTSDEGLNAYGAATWGQFFIYQGFNEHAGWMHTSSGADNVDEFAETVVTEAGGKHSYRYGKELRPVETEDRDALYRKAADGTLARRSFTDLRHPSRPDRARGERQVDRLRADEQARRRRCSSPSCVPRRSDYAGFLKVATAQGQLLEQHACSPTRKARSPICIRSSCRSRDDRFDYHKPVDGSDPATDWQGLHDLDSLPHVVTPANGWVDEHQQLAMDGRRRGQPEGRETSRATWTRPARTRAGRTHSECLAQERTSPCRHCSPPPSIPT